ncbi:MAG: MFS transporter [Burkholderiaceae bacterium]
MTEADHLSVAQRANVPRSAFIALGFAAFGSGMSMRVADPMLVRLSADFSVGLGAASAVITVFSIAYGFAQLLFGPLGDRYGKYLVISIDCLLCSLTSALCAASPGLTALLVARMLAGASCAALIPLSMAWIGDVVEYSERQAVLARFMIGLILGNGVGVMVGGFCADYLDWRFPFLLIALTFLMTGTYLARLRPTLPPHAMTRGEIHESGIRSLLKSFRKVFAIGWARMVLSSVFLEGALVFGTLAFIPTILHLRLDLSLTSAGSVVMLFGIGGLTFAIFSPIFVRRLGEGRLVRFGVCLMALAMVTLGYSPVWWLSLPACFLFGLGFYMMHNTLQINATQMAPERRGAAVAAFASFFFLGQALGVGVTGFLLEKIDTTYLSLIFALALLAVGLRFANAHVRRS